MNHSPCGVSLFWKGCLGGALALLIGLCVPAEAFALITGGEGNEPLHDYGWQKGAAAVFNVKARVAYWEGPPFGGGQYVGEYRGDATVFNAVLVDFAKIEAKKHKLFVHDGIGNSFWLNINNEEGKRKQAEIDWTFTAWIPENWKRFRRGADARPDEEGPYPEIHLYPAGRVKWEDVKVPEGVEVIDERLAAHGYAATDGTVLEGQVNDIETKMGMVAHIELQLIKTPKTGGYEYETILKTDSDAQGKWVLKSIPLGWYQVVASAEGYISRTVTHERVEDGPRWVGVKTVLAKPGPVSGVVVDVDGKPLAGVSVRFDDPVADPDEDYSATQSQAVETDADGKFSSDQIPRGRTTIWVYKEGYCRPGLGLPVKTPASDVKLSMVKSSRIEVVVDFSKSKRPEGYMVQIEPEGGSVVGSWGGSGNIDVANTITFQNVPPGRYVLKGRPNPGSTNDETDPVTIDLVGGETEPVVLEAK